MSPSDRVYYSSRRPRRSRRGRDLVLVGLVRRFFDAVMVMRARHSPPADLPAAPREPPFDDFGDDGGLTHPGVPRRPPDTSGSGSVALDEPTSRGEP